MVDDFVKVVDGINIDIIFLKCVNEFIEDI